MIARRLRALLVVGTLVLIVLTAPGASAQGSAVTTYHNDNSRTGQYLNETLLTPSNVNSNNFGKLGFLPVQGLVDGQPLYVPNVNMSDGTHNVVYVVTEHDMVYAFDADSFAQLWAVTVVGAGETPSDDHGCSQVTPEIGITSTAVIDLNAGLHGTIYLVAMSKDGNGAYHQRLHALDLATGAEQSNSPAEIQAAYGNLTFKPGDYKERAALLLLNGVTYMSFASHCDAGNYNGWIMGYNGSTLQQASVFNMTPNGQDGAIWMSEGGLAADQSGNIYFLDANGTFDTTLDANGFPVNRDFGNSFMKLSTAGGSLAAADYFAMSNVVSENGADLDLGSGGTILLPDLTDNTGKTWHLAVGAGKDKKIYVVNRDSMGKFHPNGDQIYQEIPSSSGLAGGVFSTPAYFNNTVYYASVGDHLKAFSISNAQLVAPAGSQTSTTFGYPGASPAVSANGTSNGIVWAVENGIPGTLHAYNANDLSNELYNSNQAGSRDQFQNSKFNTPMIANGKVFINGTTGVTIFGLFHPNTPPTGYLDSAANAINGSKTVPQNGVLQVSGWASDPDGDPIAQVQIVIDGNFVGQATLEAGSSWMFNYNIGNRALGNHWVTATAYDSQGLSRELSWSSSNAGNFTVTTASGTPTGYLNSAANGVNGSKTIPQNGLLSVQGWAAENGSPVARVQVTIDGNVVGNATVSTSSTAWSFNYNIGMLSTGSHWVSATAYDAQGSAAQLSWSSSNAGNFTVTMASGTPTGYLDSAANASDGTKNVPQNGTIAVKGWAAENGSPVARVQVTIDGNVVGDATVSTSSTGWSFSYNIGMLSAGSHWVNAIAYDAQGNSAELSWSSSSAGNFTVN